MARMRTALYFAGLVLFAAICTGFGQAQTQDRIYTNDNQVLIGEVLAVQATKTKYIPIGSEVFLNIDNTRISRIEFANGTVQLFRDGVPQVPVEPDLAPLPGIAPGSREETVPIGATDSDRMRQLYEKLKKKNINEMTQREYEFFKLMQAEEMREPKQKPGQAVFTPYRRQLIQGIALSAVIPGGGHFYLGKRDSGLGFLMGSVPAVAAIFAQNDQLRMAGMAGFAFLKLIDLLTIPGEINR